MSYYSDFWGEHNWGFAFGKTASYYTLGYHIGQDIFTRINGVPTTVDIPALAGGRVVRVGFSTQIGYFVVLAVGSLFHTYCHLRPSSLPKLGDVIVTAVAVAQSGSGSDYLGSASGPHLHFVVSTAISTASRPVASQVVDPRPIIRGQLGSFAGGDSTPIIEPKPRKGQLPMFGLIGTAETGAIEIYNLETAQRAPIASPDHVEWLKAARESLMFDTPLIVKSSSQWDVCTFYIRLVHTPVTVDLSPVLKRLAEIAADDGATLEGNEFEALRDQINAAVGAVPQLTADELDRRARERLAQ